MDPRRRLAGIAPDAGIDATRSEMNAIRASALDGVVQQLFEAAAAPQIGIGGESSRRVADALAHARRPLALVSGEGRVVHFNASFDRLLGTDLFLQGGHIASWRADAEQALAAAIACAVDPHGDARAPLTVVLPRRRKRPLVAQVIRVAGMTHDRAHTVSAVITLIDLAPAAGPTESLLREVFALSAAEAHLAAAIAGGKTLAEISKAEGIARETLRSQLKAVFSKTETSRQVELALLLSRLAEHAQP
jgi:DNA-binding CsgD family transcriptional regulator